MRFSALGDVAMMVPVVYSLAMTYPDVRITVLSRKFARAFFEDLAPNVYFMGADLNMEYRTFLFWKFNGAVFVDAGNIWTLRNYQEQPGGQFKFNEFYKQIAVAYGLGLRLNFDYFILRFDMGMKAVNPAYTNQREHWALFNPVFSRDFSFHFAVGMPF